MQTEGRFNGGNRRVEEEAGGKGEDAGGCKPADELRTGRDEAKRQVHWEGAWGERKDGRKDQCVGERQCEPWGSKAAAFLGPQQASVSQRRNRNDEERFSGNGKRC